MQGMDHDKMKDMHEQHMGNGHMDHGGMGGGSVDKDMPKRRRAGQSACALSRSPSPSR